MTHNKAWACIKPGGEGCDGTHTVDQMTEGRCSKCLGLFGVIGPYRPEWAVCTCTTAKSGDQSRHDQSRHVDMESGEDMEIEKEGCIEMSMIGKKVIVRANVAGVHAGIVESYTPGQCVIVLKDAYRMWRFYTRDKTGSISDVAANGLKPDGDHQIGAKLKSVLIENPKGLEVAEMTDEAYASLDKFAPKTR